MEQESSDQREPRPPQPPPPQQPATESPDRKAALRAKLFSSEANDVEIPVPPKPPEPKPENDAFLLMYVALGFFVMGVVCLGASRVVAVDSAERNPFEVFTIVSFAASGVIGIWWQIKAHKLTFHFIPPDED